MKLNQYIDHTILKANATESDVVQLCEEARQHEFFSVCINSAWVPTARKLLAGSPVKVCSVIGFPLGAMSTAAKVFEAKQAVADGADEVDMVINIGLLKKGRTDAVEAEITAVRAATTGLLKVIIESAALTDDEIVAACRAAEAAGADYVKTSTGFHPAGGASVHAVELMSATVGQRLGVKASGGIRDYATANAMVEAGATRLGLSGTRAVLDGADGVEGDDEVEGGY